LSYPTPYVDSNSKNLKKRTIYNLS